MAEAVQLYRTLDRERPGKLPPYVKAAAGHALLYLHEPRQAAALFQAAIAEGDDSFSTRMGLFYALEDAGDHDRAIDHIDRLAADQRKRIGAEDDTAERENTSYVSARTAAALARSWANDQEEAQRRLAALAEAAPHNGEVRSAAAGVMRSRGWPRRASDAYAEIVANDPDDAGARAEHAQALLDFDSFRAAEAEVRAARAQRPEDSGVRRAGRLWDIHQGAELDVDAGMGRSSGNAPTGTRDAHIESYLYSPPIDYNWRPFIHAYWAEGRFTDATARIERWAGGLEYRNAGLVLSGEASTGCCGSGRIGAAAAAQWWTDDHWHINGAAELQSNQVPLQARLAGYSADRAAAGTGYRFNERHAFDINAGVLHISDGNVRRSVYATWDERLYASARLKLDLRAGVYASANTRSDAPYFNPRSDFSPAATLSLEWLTWHSYDRSFSQKLSGTLGTYDQAGFGAIRTSELLYEHIWDIDNFLSVRYGAGRVVHPYDGRQSGRNYLNLALVARFW